MWVFVGGPGAEDMRLFGCEGGLAAHLVSNVLEYYDKFGIYCDFKARYK